MECFFCSLISIHYCAHVVIWMDGTKKSINLKFKLSSSSSSSLYYCHSFKVTIELCNLSNYRHHHHHQHRYSFSVHTIFVLSLLFCQFILIQFKFVWFSLIHIVSFILNIFIIIIGGCIKIDCKLLNITQHFAFH